VRADAVRVEMRDTGIQADPRVRRPDLGGGGGFGMVLVERMSQRWGVDHEPRDGRLPQVVMWFELLREPIAGGAPELERRRHFSPRAGGDCPRLAGRALATAARWWGLSLDALHLQLSLRVRHLALA
jgi:hypothetical protein